MDSLRHFYSTETEEVIRIIIDNGKFIGVKLIMGVFKVVFDDSEVIGVEDVFRNRENNADNSVNEEAVVIGGKGANARKCISAASCTVDLEILPEVRYLCEILSKKEEISPASPDRLSTDSPIKVSKRSDSSQRNKNPRRIKKAVIIIAAAFLLLMTTFGIYEAYKITSIVDSINYQSGNLNFNSIDVLVSQSDTGLFVSHTDETKNILLCGCDIDENGISRTDSMIILSIDHAHQKIKMTSLMRDMYLQIPGHGKNKLNSAYTFGGGELLLKTVYSNFGMKIDRYVCIDYGVFASVVDDLGGIEIEIEEMELEQFNKYVRGGSKNRITEAGRYTLNGQQALSYCRIRKVGSDTARTARQRKVLGEIIKKCRSLSLTQTQRIFAVVAPFVITNMSRDEMTSLLIEGLESMNYDAMGLRIPMDGAWQDKKDGKSWYVEVDLNQNARYMNHFIYGDDDTAQKLIDRQQKVDDQNAEYERRSFEKKKKKG